MTSRDPDQSRDPEMVKVMTPIYLGPITSTMVGDTDLVPIEHL